MSKTLKDKKLGEGMLELSITTMVRILMLFLQCAGAQYHESLSETVNT